MTKTAKSHEGIGDPATGIADVPSVSPAERQILRDSLDRARSDIAAGNFDVVTPETLWAEFDCIFPDDDHG